MLNRSHALLILSLLLAACARPTPTASPTAVSRPPITLTPSPGPGATVSAITPTAVTSTAAPLVPTASPASTLAPTPDPLVIGLQNAARVQQIAELRRTFTISQTAESDTEPGLIAGLTATNLSPDGQRLAVATASGIYLYDLTTFEQIRFFDTGPGVAFQVFFLADGRTLASFSPHLEGFDLNQTIQFWDIVSSQLIRTITLNPSLTRLGKASLNVALSPDLHTLAIGFVEGPITLLDINTGQESPSWKGADVRAARFIFSHDGRRLATMYGDTTIWDVATRRVLLNPVKYGTATGLYVNAAFSP